LQQQLAALQTRAVGGKLQDEVEDGEVQSDGDAPVAEPSVESLTKALLQVIWRSLCIGSLAQWF